MTNDLFIGVYPCGLVYADRTRELDGDYLRLAFLPYRTLVLEWDKASCPHHLRTAIESHAASMATQRGRQFNISSCGQTVTLGQP